MSKYCKRLSARMSRNALREAVDQSKNWIVSKKLILETEEGDLEFEPGEQMEIGATPEGDMAINGSAAVVVISDPELASKIADVVVSSDELSDVKFVDKPALDAVVDGEDVDSVIDDLSANEDDSEDVEVAELDVEKKESVESKFEKFSEHRINPLKALVCESILIDEEYNAPLNMSTIKADRVMRESLTDYNVFVARVSEMKGSLQPGKREIALGESGKVIGAFDKDAKSGILFLENEFDSVEDMDAFDTEPEALMQDYNFQYEDMDEIPDMEALDGVLGAYEESAKTGEDYKKLTESLVNLKLKESSIADIVSSFDSHDLKECVKAFDTRYGKFVRTFKESVDCDNFMAETGDEKRFTKRFFA